MNELPLVFFTVLCQIAVGGYVLLYISYKFSLINERNLAVGLLSAMGLFVAGVLIGTIHFGQLFRVFNLLAGLGHSPMSNEAVFSGLFVVTGGLAALRLFFNKGSKGLCHLLALIAAVIGAIFVAIIPTLYQLDTVATWNSNYTTMLMILTVLIGGGAFAALFGATRFGAVVSGVAIIAALVIRPDYLNFLAQTNITLALAQGSLFTLQAVLLIVGLILAVFIVSKRIASRMILVSCLSVVLVGELLGRVAFYNLWAITM